MRGDQYDVYYMVRNQVCEWDRHGNCSKCPHLNLKGNGCVVILRITGAN